MHSNSQVGLPVSNECQTIIDIFVKDKSDNMEDVFSCLTFYIAFYEIHSITVADGFIELRRRFSRKFNNTL